VKTINAQKLAKLTRIFKALNHLCLREVQEAKIVEYISCEGTYSFLEMWKLDGRTVLMISEKF